MCLVTPLMLYRASVTTLQDWIEDVADCVWGDAYQGEDVWADQKAIEKEIALRRSWAE